MTNAYVVTGTLTSATTVQLDEPLPLSAGKVRVVVEAPGSPPRMAMEPLADFLARLHRKRAEAGIAPLTAEQIEEWAADVRTGRED